MASRTSSAKRSGHTVLWPASQPSSDRSAICIGLAFGRSKLAPIPVSMKLGRTVVTVAPSPRSSSRTASASIRHAALLAL